MIFASADSGKGRPMMTMAFLWAGKVNKLDTKHSGDCSVKNPSLRSELEGRELLVTTIYVNSVLISECSMKENSSAERPPDQKPAILKSQFNGPLISWSAIKGGHGDPSLSVSFIQKSQSISAEMASGLQTYLHYHHEAIFIFRALMLFKLSAFD